MRTSIPRIIFITLFSGIIGTAYQIDQARPPEKVLLQKTHYPDAERMKPLCFGYTEIASDLVWIQILLYYGAHILHDERFDYMDRMTETAISLDPRFAGLYSWATSTATWRTRRRSYVADENLWLENYYAMLGMRRLPNDWRFPYLLGSNWYYDRDNLIKTKYYWEIAAKLPGADPLILERLGTVHRRLGELEKAIQRLEDLLHVVTEPKLKEEIVLRIEAFKRRLKKKAKEKRANQSSRRDIP
ncbi:MAG: hypothetical protein GXP49_16145 [Deltaproteobacteria bacterium]|nr:hypothetical protein [Deltaproteobacteria bacterium]